MKRKIIVLIVLIAVILPIYGMHLIENNYRLGRKLYDAVCTASVQSHLLDDSISFLKGEFAKADNEQAEVNRHSFDFAIAGFRSGFGYDNMPILDDVRVELIDRFEELYHQTFHDEGLKKLFTEEPDKVDGLQYTLRVMTDCFVDFRDRYIQMPRWKWYFGSWKNERKILTDQISETMMNW